MRITKIVNTLTRGHHQLGERGGDGGDMWRERNRVLGHDSALLGTTWANEMNFVMNHAAGV